MIHVNLIPHARRARRRAAARARAWIAINAATLLLLLGAALAFRALAADPADAALPERLRLAQERLQSAQARDRTALASLKNLQAAVQTARRAADRPDWSLLLALLDRHRGDDIMYETITLAGGLLDDEPAPGSSAAARTPTSRAARAAPKPKVERYSLALTGIASSPNAASALVLRLEQTGLFTRLQLGETRPRDAEGLPRTAFRIDALLRQQSVTTPPGAPTSTAPGDGSAAAPGVDPLSRRADARAAGGGGGSGDAMTRGTP